jgi:MinD-like ATPase involved in chromosome partitioning or flagellar assembly
MTIFEENALYIVTFYSFRGGVGRTTALMNVAWELARRGRKVLLVDFDLESPDLTTFPGFARPEPQAGLVEYVTAYREKGLAPDITEYLYPLEPVGPKQGRLWVMPAGRYKGFGYNDKKYWEAMEEIDWQSLYNQQEGYLFFEDTCLQWEALGVDYVLIDTHAGRTTSLGITTRQLADAVVMVFNSHRDSGELEEVSYRIYEAAEQTGRDPIEQLFVISGVVGDEEGPVRAYEVSFDVNSSIVATIPFSHSLLLGKKIVVGESAAEAEYRRLVTAGTYVEPPLQSRLVQEYRWLTNAVIAANLAGDKDGARMVLCEIHADPAKAVGEIRFPDAYRVYFAYLMVRRNYPAMLDKILNEFPKDADIQAQAACCLYGAARYDRALQALDTAIELRPDAPDLRWQRASWRRQQGMIPGAAADLLKILDIYNPGPAEANPTVSDIKAMLETAALAKPQPQRRRFALPEEFEETWQGPRQLPDYSDPLLTLQGVDPYIVSTMRQLRQLDPDKYEEAKRKPCIMRLSEEVQQRLFADRLPDQQGVDLYSLIRARKWSEVRALLQPRRDKSDRWSLDEAIFLFMAYWGLDDEKALRACGEKAKDCFLRELKSLDSPDTLMMYQQIMAVIFWKIEEVDVAYLLLDYIEDWPEDERPIFSYWRCAMISWNLFKEDCRSLRQIFKGANCYPPFLGKEPVRR